MSSMHDHILVYAVGGPSQFRDTRNRIPRSDGAFTNPDRDPRGPWTSTPFTAQGYRPNQMYTIVTPTGTSHDPPPGRCWSRTEAGYRELLDDGRIHFPSGGDGRPRVKKYEFEDSGLVPETLWLAKDVGTNDDAKRHIQTLFPGKEPFATPKPESLLQRVIHIGSNPGDLVLDCFAGSGTTAATAHKMGRRWLTIERSPTTVADFTVPRLRAVVGGQEPGGITDDVGWSGGGGFHTLRVGQSIYDIDIESGDVFMADTATNGTFAQACAAQLGFERDERGPFVGRKGRTRLAALDGVVGPDEIDFLVGHLEEGERLTVVAKVFEEGADERLRDLVPGSRTKKAPNDLVGGRLL